MDNMWTNNCFFQIQRVKNCHLIKVCMENNCSAKKRHINYINPRKKDDIVEELCMLCWKITTSLKFKQCRI